LKEKQNDFDDSKSEQTARIDVTDHADVRDNIILSPCDFWISQLKEVSCLARFQKRIRNAVNRNHRHRLHICVGKSEHLFCKDESRFLAQYISFASSEVGKILDDYLHMK
jgi:hypothetical protein